MKIAIIGGGISGLSLGYFLKRFSKKDSIKITIFEKSNKLGGWISSTTTADNGIVGRRFDFGPKSIRIANPKIEPLLYMLQEIKGSEEFLKRPINDPASRARYIYLNNKLNLISLSNPKIFKMLFSLDNFSKTFSYSRLKSIDYDLSIYDYFSIFLSQEIVEKIITPIFYGIYATDIKNLSLKFCLPMFWQCRSNPLLLLTNKSNNNFTDPYLSKCNFERFTGIGMVSTHSGISGIIRMLEGSKELKCESVNINKNVDINEISYNSNLFLKNNDVIHSFDHVFSTISTKNLNNIMNCDKLRNILSEIRYSSVAVVSLEYRLQDIQNNIPTGFGFLAPPSETSIQPILGVVYDSNIFETSQNNDTFLLTVIMGGDNFIKNFGFYEFIDQSVLFEKAVNVMNKIFCWKAIPKRYAIRILKDSLPIMSPGHSDTVSQIKELTKNDPITISGAAISGPSIPDCVYHSYMISRSFLESKNLHTDNLID